MRRKARITARNMNNTGIRLVDEVGSLCRMNAVIFFCPLSLFIGFSSNLAIHLAQIPYALIAITECAVRQASQGLSDGQRIATTRLATLATGSVCPPLGLGCRHLGAAAIHRNLDAVISFEMSSAPGLTACSASIRIHAVCIFRRFHRSHDPSQRRSPPPIYIRQF
jgi:hypothetical protein